jgi:hypothetical protein
LALIRSTVTPGQLPTRADAPVRRLKKVDLPVFGIPRRAMRFMVSAGQAHVNAVRVTTAHHHVGGAEANVQRAGATAAPHDLQWLADAKTERAEAVMQFLTGVNGADGGGLPGLELIERKVHASHP